MDWFRFAYEIITATRKVERHYNLSFTNQEQNVFLVYKC